MARKGNVKLVRVGHGIFGNPDNRRIKKAIEKWMSKGFRLDKQQDERGRGLQRGYTLLTFIKDKTSDGARPKP
jgi:hypothetical protein